MKKFYTAKYDRVFKTILCDEENKELLREFLSRILKKQVEIIEFLRNELPVESVIEKIKTVDVLVKVDNEYIHIELNTSIPRYLHTRNFAYFSSIYARKTEKGEKYDYKIKFLHIDLTYGMSKKDKEFRKYYLMDDEFKKYIDNIEIIEYNMDKIMDYWYNKDEIKTNEYKHLIMLDINKEGLNILSEGDDFVKEFEERLEELNERETFQSLMTYEQDQQMILNTEKSISFEDGIEKGIEKGIEAGKIEIVKNMLKKNLPLKEISEISGMSIEKVEKIQKQSL